MRALVSCPHRLLLVDIHSHEVSVLEDSRREYYGVSWSHDGRSLCLGHSGVDHVSLKTLEDYADSERGWISLGKRRGSEFLSAPHQLLCTDSHIIATNTGRNCLAVVNQSDLFYQNRWLDGVRWDCKGADCYVGGHFNSVFLRDGRLYLLAHNFNRGSYVLVLSWPDLTILEKRPTTVRESHNVWVTASEQIIVCDSLGAGLVEITSGQRLFSSTRPNAFLRGLASDGKVVLAGHSLIAGWKGRVDSDGGIYVLDAQSWKELDFIPLPVSGAVHEVRLIDVPDDCHHGHLLRIPLVIDAEAGQRYEDRRREVEHRRKLAEMWAGWKLHLGEMPALDENSITLAGEALTLATTTAAPLGDVSVLARLRLPGTGFAGLVARYQGPEDRSMYLGMIYCENGLRRADIWRNSGGEWVLLQQAPLPEPSDTYDLRLEVSGRQLRFFVNGALAVQTEDDALPLPGAVGLRGTSGQFLDFASAPFAPPAEPQ